MQCIDAHKFSFGSLRKYTALFTSFTLFQCLFFRYLQTNFTFSHSLRACTLLSQWLKELASFLRQKLSGKMYSDSFKCFYRTKAFRHRHEHLFLTTKSIVQWNSVFFYFIFLWPDLFFAHFLFASKNLHKCGFKWRIFNSLHRNNQRNVIAHIFRFDTLVGTIDFFFHMPRSTSDFRFEMVEEVFFFQQLMWMIFVFFLFSPYMCCVLYSIHTHIVFFVEHVDFQLILH